MKLPSQIGPKLAAYVLASSLLAVGCGSEQTAPEGPDPDPVVEEPITGTPDAPPLGAPRAKLSPGELTPEEDEE